MTNSQHLMNKVYNEVYHLLLKNISERISSCFFTETKKAIYFSEASHVSNSLSLSVNHWQTYVSFKEYSKRLLLRRIARSSPTTFVNSFVGSYAPKIYLDEDIIVGDFTILDSQIENIQEAFLFVITYNSEKNPCDKNLHIWLNTDLYYRTSLHKKIQKYLVEPVLLLSKEKDVNLKITYTSSQVIFNNMFHTLKVTKEPIVKTINNIKQGLKKDILKDREEESILPF